MTEKTKLNVSPAMQAFATEHGAYFDKGLGVWVVYGDVPGPLISFIDVQERRRDYVKESVPQCDQCGAQMVTRTSRATGAPFWGCSTRACPGKRPYDDVFIRRQQKSTPVNEQVSFEDKGRASRLIEEAVKAFGNNASAYAWLKAPKVALAGQTPYDAIKTVAGCIVVERLLAELFK